MPSFCFFTLASLFVRLIGIFFVASFSAHAAEPVSTKEMSLLLSDHALVDTIWRTSTSRKIDADSLKAALRKSDFVLLGEKHDNARHHHIQAELSAAILQGSSKPAALIFEMLEPAHQDSLDKADSYSLEELGSIVEWEARGWPSWQDYQPIFAKGREAGAPLFSGNPNRKMLMDIGRGGALSQDDLVGLRWEQDYNEDQRDSLLDELVDSHCGMMGREQMAPLVTLQRLKDAFMGRAMRLNGKDRPAILIAGNGHVRKDRGVPFFLDQDKETLSVAVLEVVRGKIHVENYPAFDAKLYDYVWFTPRVDEIDPCEKFREQLERMKEKMKAKSDHKDNG
ncbi:MAG: ChaN family lipoprotein [Cohaesibacter sp.]|nr:ChaN family lipoprotein [Cohaesibacter sp.]